MGLVTDALNVLVALKNPTQESVLVPDEASLPSSAAYASVSYDGYDIPDIPDIPDVPDVPDISDVPDVPDDDIPYHPSVPSDWRRQSSIPSRTPQPKPSTKAPASASPPASTDEPFGPPPSRPSRQPSSPPEWASLPGDPSIQPPSRKRPRPSPRAIMLSPGFKLTFLTVTALTILSGAAHAAFAIGLPSMNANQQSVFEAFGFAWKAGIGVLFGLLGGKVT
jgi:hypothetical protein